ncbi:MAG: amino acid ABC transporter substrate-binding protein [Methylocystaceae bacterium]|jgi:general L-amino acid transport system substrate-binding protein|nr:amino acid ABC transporter substrate-binding protein [Methylocystaceae bacterium]
MRFYQKGIMSAAVFGALTLLTSLGAQASTLDTVKQRGSLICGVSNGIAGFSISDEKGAWTGFDVDFCRAVASAIFGDATKVQFVPVKADERFAALKENKFDLLSRNSTWSFSNEVEQGLQFAGVTYYDGQGFLVSKKRKVTSALELDGSKICVKNGTNSEANVADYFKSNRMKFEPIRFETMKEIIEAYQANKCDVISSDVSQLYAERLSLTKPNENVILADVISKEPLGPAVRQGDDQWLNLVKWVNYAMLNAEELGITKANVAQAKQSQKPAVRRLIGAEGDIGKQLGLSPDWAYNIVKNVGNYGETLEKNVGGKSKLGIARGLNQLWTMGGIQYAPPLR